MSGVGDWLLAIVLQAVFLGLVLLIAKWLRRPHCMAEAGIVGLLAGGAVHLCKPSVSLAAKLSFQNGLFMYVLLPVIMFDAGYRLDPNPLIRNLGAVCTYAFLGTVISTFVVGLMMWGFGALGWCTPLSAVFSLLFGALISATDPVSVLAVFSSLGVNEDLYVLVFGEAVLNDAVAMELYVTLKGFVGATVTAGAVFKGIGLFVAVFCGSVLLGGGLGLLTAWASQTTWFKRGQHRLVEIGVVLIVAYGSYLAAYSAKMSGICAVLFCAMVMRSFLAPNLSSATQQQLLTLPKAVAGIFEVYLFMQIGLTFFLRPENYFDVGVLAFTCLSLVALGIGRILNVIPCSRLINWLRLPSKQVLATQQFMMWWSGLRGAMAFSLAMDAADAYGEEGGIIKTCTFYVVFATVLYNGSFTEHFLDELDLKQTSDSAGLLHGALSSGKAVADVQLAGLPVMPGSPAHPRGDAKGQFASAISTGAGGAEEGLVPSPHARTIPYTDFQGLEDHDRGLNAKTSVGEARGAVDSTREPRKTAQDVIWLPPPRYSTLFSWKDLIFGSYHGFGQGGVSDADLSRATSRKALEEVSELARASRDTASLAATSSPWPVRSEAGLPGAAAAQAEAGGHNPDSAASHHEAQFDMIELHEDSRAPPSETFLSPEPSLQHHGSKSSTGDGKGSLLHKVREFNSSFDNKMASWGRTLSLALTPDAGQHTHNPEASQQPAAGPEHSDNPYEKLDMHLSLQPGETSQGANGSTGQ